MSTSVGAHESAPVEQIHAEPRRGPSRSLRAPLRAPLRSRRGWFGAAGSARTRILISYVVLLTLSALLSTFAIREVLALRLEQRIDAALQQEAAEFDRLYRDGRDPGTGRPFTSLAALFDVYLDRNVPSAEEALLAFVDGATYRSVLDQFPVDRIPAQTLAYWQVLSSRPSRGDGRIAGRYETDEGTARFEASRIHFRDGETGAFVVTILPATQLDEIDDLQVYGVAAVLGVLLLASAVAWFIAGRVLAPVRLLTETAHSISQSNLARRVDVRGSGEAADMARTFNAMLDRLEGVFRNQREFVQDTSHELRDPLTICRGHLELLGEDPEERRETIALVLDEIDRMGAIVNDLQLLAEVEQSDFLRPESLDLQVLTHELVAKAGALASRNWSLDAVADGTFDGDRHRITEAVMNLAHNAVQHTVADDTIAIGSALEDGEVRIWVRDTGAGIPLSDQIRIFERFTRGRGADRRYRGGGLGLAIVKAIAEAHGGRVDLDSRLGSGSTFTIVLPVEGPRGEVDDGADPDR